MDQGAYENVVDDSGDGFGQETERCLDSTELLNFLKVESEHRLERVEASPDEKDSYADGGEDTIAPERVRNDGRSS